MPSLIASMFRQTCPRCRTGKLYQHPNPYRFKSMTTMHKNCPHCGQDFGVEPGFYFGAAYVSYGFNIAIMVAVFVALYVFNLATFWNVSIGLLATVILLTPVILRWSRSIWIHAFVKYQPEKATKP